MTGRPCCPLWTYLHMYRESPAYKLCQEDIYRQGWPMFVTMTLTSMLTVTSLKQAETAMRGLLYLEYCNHHAFEVGVVRAVLCVLCVCVCLCVCMLQ